MSQMVNFLKPSIFTKTRFVFEFGLARLLVEAKRKNKRRK